MKPGSHRFTLRGIPVKHLPMAATTPLLPRGGERYDPKDLYDEGFVTAGTPRAHYAPGTAFRPVAPAGSLYSSRTSRSSS